MAKSKAAWKIGSEGNKIVKIHGFLMPYPKDRLKTGLSKSHPATYRPIHKSVQLFKSGQKWWLYYNSNYCTGHFFSKERAIGWFEGGGR